jgi:hypothetical protein
MTDYAADRLKVRHPGPVKGTTEETSVQIRLAVPVFKPEETKGVREFILQHHYSKTVPTGKNLFFGCYVDGKLFAVADYASFASRSEPHVVLGEGYEDATRDNTLELRRLCRLGEKGEPGAVKMSDFLRECHDLIRLIENCRYILSYSDQQYNKFAVQFKRSKHKSGGIYKHAGFVYLGETAEEIHVIDAEGNRFHRSRAYRKMLAHNLALCAKLNFVPAKKTTGNKDRIWPDDPKLWISKETWARVKRRWPKPKLSAKRLWKLDQVRDAMGFKIEKRPPKDKWLLTL